jgi:hypothetical protein
VADGFPIEYINTNPLHCVTMLLETRISLVLLFAFMTPPFAAAEDTVLWRVGLRDDSSSEFTGQAFPALYPIPTDWAQRSQWPEFAPQVTGNPDRHVASDKLDTTFQYSLPAVPAHGAVFRFKTLNASSFVTEVAVFANGLPCGILQMVGTEGWLGEEQKGRRFGNTYAVYVPPEFFRAGGNTLRIEKLGHPYCRENTNYSSVTLDWLELVGLSRPAAEPLHSRLVHIGSQLGEFHYNDRTLAAEPLSWQWLGVAHSGNPIRAPFWDNTQHLAPKSVEYLQTARDYNMTVILNYTHCMKTARSGKPEFATPTGELDPFWKGRLKEAFDQWGGLVQYFEITNEPCMSISDVPLAASLAVAKYAREIKPAHLKIAAPAWTYGGGHGEPKDWDISVANRLAVERFCDTTNGHSYGNSYVGPRGSLLSTIDSYGRDGVVANGFPREYINTEMGTHRQVHIDFMNLGVNHALNASMHDRISRAHIGFCDIFLNFATFPFGDIEFRTIEGDQYQPETWVAAEFEPKEEFRQHAQDSRVKVFRRLALAYATHGKPLPYVYPDEGQVQDQLVYFRGVDTSTLPPLPGSGGKSKKVLLNFVNFSRAERTMTVRVTLPSVGIYAGVRFGPDDQYLAARSLSQLQATPDVPLTETLGPGEAVQYILEKDERLTQLAACPAAPTNLRATGGKIGKLGYVKLAWDCGPADEIKIQRSADGIRFLQIDALPAAQHAYEDASRTGPEPGRAYWYRVKAATARGESAVSNVIRLEIPR